MSTASVNRSFISLSSFMFYWSTYKIFNPFLVCWHMSYACIFKRQQTRCTTQLPTCLVAPILPSLLFYFMLCLIIWRRNSLYYSKWSMNKVLLFNIYDYPNNIILTYNLPWFICTDNTSKSVFSNWCLFKSLFMCKSRQAFLVTRLPYLRW